MRLPRPAPFVCRACSHGLRAPLSRSSLGARHASSGSSAFPFRVAVIGSGPAGFYSAYRLMSRMPRAHVDMYEQQPVPYGLVRFGVAPDHPEVKYCQEKFEEVAASPRFTFIGNVQVGTHLPLSALADHYDAILFAYGASKDKELNIPGEGLDGVYSARAFVGWYNGLPEYADLDPVLDTAKDAVIVGQGNVALDVARILLSNVDELRKTDIAEHALEKLSRSKIDSIRIVGRRGPMQAAYTIKEIRELFNLPNVFFNPIPSPLFPPPEYKLNRQMTRLTKILQEGSPNGAPPQDSPAGTKQWALNHFLAPAAFRGATSGAARIKNAIFRHTSFRVPLGGDRVDPFNRSATVEPSPGGYTTTYPADIAFRSVGYKAEPLPGFEALGIPFYHHNGTIPHDGDGRVAATPVRRVETGRPPTPPAPGIPVEPPNGTIPDHGNDPVTSFDHLPGMYVAGWVKRGPTGVILTTMQDAFSTADSILADWARTRPFLPSDARGWKALRDRAVDAGARPVSWEDWKRIDAAERERGKEQGRVRAKFVRTEDMLKVLDG
ncbi:NADPH-adrenodoxin reductase [Diplodia intermedia]|uniref:NADPH:adrenodoxin oxidoreductase, mitochondrial n=1 Tax=Diplodia intermedia TaxID=856260 RepID=A0ABR3TLQ3_9PEZI